MSLDVFFADDIRRLLSAVAIVGERIPDAAERRGFELALEAVAAATGVSELEERPRMPRAVRTIEARVSR